MGTLKKHTHTKHDTTLRCFLSGIVPRCYFLSVCLSHYPPFHSSTHTHTRTVLIFIKKKYMQHICEEEEEDEEESIIAQVSYFSVITKYNNTPHRGEKAQGKYLECDKNGDERTRE